MFAIKVLVTAVYPDGPSGLVTRTADTVARFIVHAREKNRSANPSVYKLLDIRRTTRQLY